MEYALKKFNVIILMPLCVSIYQSNKSSSIFKQIYLISAIDFRKRRKKPIWIYLDSRCDDKNDDEDSGIKEEKERSNKTPSSSMGRTFVVKSPKIEQTIVEPPPPSKSLESSTSNSRESSASRCQFHQCFMHAFFVQKRFAQLFSSYVLALAEIFWQKINFVQKVGV